MLQEKEDFINIILVFDYERHDTNFSEKKILEMQERFNDAADMGKLYINYPMIESYRHLKSLPDYEYCERKIPVALQPGKKYKLLVDCETAIGKSVDFPHRLDDLLDGRFGITDEVSRNECCNAVLEISDENGIDDRLLNILQGTGIGSGRLNTLKYQLKDWIIKMGYVHNGQTYWNYMREIFKKVIYYNLNSPEIITRNILKPLNPL